ncbi:MAG: hypothetical protein CMH62_00460 [Nanoarchaeota archaeon]|nr:hypothetical protein [Nanoarchaeota archaeon]|tara:strand:+ start:1228 stop:1767 length:540 start_codon:yes stop_codon:yes gene_type:complete
MVTKLNLLRFLRANKNVRKIFGEKELRIIEKQLFGQELTQSEKNRLSRDVRKKFNFIQEASVFDDDVFRLKKGSLIQEILEEAVKVIKKDVLNEKINKVILYNPDEDNKITDVFVVFSEIQEKEVVLFRRRMIDKVNSRVNIRIYNFLSKKIKESIDEKGKVLYEIPNKSFNQDRFYRK